MLLTGLNLIHYLLYKGLVDRAACVKGDFKVWDQSSRNVNFMVERTGGPSYVVKQAKTWNPDQIETLRVEASCYWLANNDERFQVFRSFLPRFFSFDFVHHILITELLSSSKDLFQYYWTNKDFDSQLGNEIARILLSYHTIPFSEIPPGTGTSFFRGRLPWVFTFSHKPLAYWENALPDVAGRQAMQLIYQIPEFIEHVNEAGSEWTKTSLIHGDLRFNNFLLNENFRDIAVADLKLIDWELADQGDPLWDVASVLQNFLTLWLSSEEQGNKSIDLEAFKPTMAAFWRTYSDAMNWDVLKSRDQWKKTIRFCGLRLINSCFEATPHTKNLQPYSAKALQLSLNLLKLPMESGHSLFGLKY